MIKFPINKNNGSEHAYQVLGYMDVNGKDIHCKFFVYANDEEEAKQLLSDYKAIRLMRYNLQTLADVQNAYKKEFGKEAELESLELKNYMK